MATAVAVIWPRSPGESAAISRLRSSRAKSKPEKLRRANTLAPSIQGRKKPASTRQVASRWGSASRARPDAASSAGAFGRALTGSVPSMTGGLFAYEDRYAERLAALQRRRRHSDGAYPHEIVEGEVAVRGIPQPIFRPLRPPDLFQQPGDAYVYDLGLVVR